MWRTFIKSFLLFCFYSLILPGGALSEVISDANVAAKLVCHLVPQSSMKRGQKFEPPPCNSGEIHLLTGGEIGAVYDLYVMLQDVSSESPIEGITFRIEYDQGKSLEILSWESFVDAQITFPNSTKEDWPATGSGVMLMFPQSHEFNVAPFERDRLGTLRLGKFVVRATSATTFRFEPRSPGISWSGVDVTDSKGGEQTITAPDNLGQVTFGIHDGGYDPCAEAIPNLGTSGANYSSVKSVPIAVESRKNPFATSIEWSVTSNRTRRAMVSVYSVAGRIIKRWANFSLHEGLTKLSWDGTGEGGLQVGSGVYYLSVESEDGYHAVTKAVLVRK